jgi:hypothetical protein
LILFYLFLRFRIKNTPPTTIKATRTRPPTTLSTIIKTKSREINLDLKLSLG